MIICHKSDVKLIKLIIRQQMRSTFSKKRDKFHSQVRQRFIQDYIKKVRYQVLQSQSHHALDDLIEATQEGISQNQLRLLVEWANQKDQNNAIIHIGNLIIDRVLDEKHLSDKFQLRPKNSQFWPWLIRVLISFDQRNQNLFEYILPMFFINQCLEILKMMLKKYQQNVLDMLLKKYQTVILKVKEYCLHSDRTISELSYQIIDIIIQSGDVQTVQLLGICTISEIQRVLIIGFSKIDPVQKKFPFLICRMVNNIFTSKVTLSKEIVQACINVSLLDHNKQKIKLQISYLWLSFLQNCSNKMLINAIQMKIFNVFQMMLTSQYNNEDHFKEIKQNIRCSLKIILQKAQQDNQEIYMLINASVSMINCHYNLIQENKEYQAQGQVGYELKNNGVAKNLEINCLDHLPEQHSGKEQLQTEYRMDLQ